MHIQRVSFQGQAYWTPSQGEEVLLLDQTLTEVIKVARDEVLPLPLLCPGKIVCVGLNYYAHAREMNKPVPAQPLLFLKPPSAVIDSGQPIRLPGQSQEVHYEGELAVVIGSLSRNLAPDQVTKHILGYTCANDVTARDLQTHDGLYARAKGFDTFCPLGPAIATDVQALGDVSIRTLVNEKEVQSGRSSDMIVSPLELVAFVSQIMTLHPGDVLLTGTPPGVGQIEPGDKVRVEIEGIGSLVNPVWG